MALVRSKRRIADYGEVFTPACMVDAMLDLVKDESERIDARFLEPACGSGNFLVPVLQRKLTIVHARYGRKEFERRHYALLAAMSLYGIELLDDNVSECRENLLTVFVEFLQIQQGNEWYAAAERVLASNIVHGDALSMVTHERDPQPIAFAEWAYLGRGMYQRRDFRFDALMQMSSLSHEPQAGDRGKHEVFMPVRDYPPLSVCDIAMLETSGG